MKEITSLQNDKVKQWRKLHTKKGRIHSQSFIVEGFHLVEEAIQSDWHVKEIIISDETADLPDWLQENKFYQLRKNVFENICQTEHPQGIAAVVDMKFRELPTEAKNLLLLDGIQDPGNLGTIIRTADACGFDGVILGNGTVDAFNDKVIRSTQGSIFHIAMEHADLSAKIPYLQKSGFSVWAAALKGAVDYQQIKAADKTALMLGNEGSGIQETLQGAADKIVKIPIYGEAESLNVSIAAGILMYHVKHSK